METNETAGRLLAVIPAHNEADLIGETLAGLQAQTTPPDSVIVVADNCTDETVSIARSMGATVFETVGNTDKKAGALNQALAFLLPTLAPADLILVQDADSTLDSGFVEGALKALSSDPGLGAVGGTFRGSPGGGIVGHLQRNEYSRYERDVNRLNGKCLVVTGTAALFRVSTLRHVLEARETGEGGVAPGTGVYDTSVLTEDNELTFALLHLGYRVKCPEECTLLTEVMPTWSALWNQRLRWKRGALENCAQYGLTRITWKYWGRQLMSLLGVLVTVLYLGSLIWGSIAGMELQPAWLAVTGVFILERAVTVHRRGWKYSLAAATMYELPFDLFLQAVHGVAFFKSVTRQRKDW